ncbi:MAG: tail fiber domain-containing protein, partial [Candidatus Taylorbacteria bacterium]|nr:tail fiber domain-containing protein [Candidatus Taylorbacteria bacterium]
TPSDISLKENVVPLTNSLDRLLKLQGVSYDWKDKERFGNTKEIGFVAQQVESIVPEVVKGGSYKSLNYGNMVALVVEAVKELNTKVDAITTRLDSIQESLKNMVFDRFTAKIAYVDEANIKNLNVDKLKTGDTSFTGNVCVDNVCITKDQLKTILLQGGGATYGTAADQMKGINPLDVKPAQIDNTPITPTATTTQVEVATSTVPVISTTPIVETTEATTTPAVVPIPEETLVTPVAVPETIVVPPPPTPTETASSTTN